MTDYKPGTVALATVNSADDVQVMRVERNGSLDFAWVTPTCYHAIDREVSNIRPLVVLDLAGCGNVATQLRYIADQYTVNADRSLLLNLADQIEAQTKPTRIPEPGLWGVVESGIGTFVRTDDTVWRDTVDGVGRTWDEIPDPVLVREGAQS